MVDVENLTEEEAMRIAQGIENLEYALAHVKDLNIVEALAYMGTAQLMLGPLQGMRDPKWLDEAS